MSKVTPSVLDRYPDYELTIGIEVHVQLTTKTKIFCACPNEISKEPNSNICVVCTGYPGVLPVFNKAVLDCAIRAGLATNCVIAHESAFDRKHYFYPDLPKNYQITQNFQPICTDGHLPIRLEDGSIKKIRLIRIHMEEDAGKNIHATKSQESFVDLNRAGTPLLEIVSYPDIASTYEARTYLKTLRAIVQYLGICSGNMEEGAFRADTNISVRKRGTEKLGTKVELKNINSFKFISDAIEFEIERQIEQLEQGSQIIQETRLWDSARKQTFSMRSKEEATDYRYFQDPDLPLLIVDQETIDAIKQSMPEMPAQKFERLCTDYGLSSYEADILIEDPALADYFEQAYKHCASPLIINWILRDLMAFLKDQNITLTQCNLTPQKLALIVNLIKSGVINNRSAQEIFHIVALEGKNPAELVKELGLEQVGSTEELEVLVREVITQHAQVVADYKAGNERLFGFLVGKVMQKTAGKGNPRVINELLKKALG